MTLVQRMPNPTASVDAALGGFDPGGPASPAERLAATVPGVTLGRRLSTFRASRAPAPLRGGASASGSLASRLADAVGGSVLDGPEGRVIRVDAGSMPLPLDRERLSWVPGQPPPDRSIVCLDTETTGLGTGAGTVAFLVGIARWDAGVLHLVQLLLPDHGDESALLDAVAAEMGPAPALVTYNGRTFDWPLLVARYRIHGRPAPSLAAHVDLLTTVRRLFRHRLGRARLRTAEEGLLGLRRTDDVEGWEIPELYHAFLRGGSAEPLARVVRHNAEDVRSLGRLLRYIDRNLADPTGREVAHPGDIACLAGLLRANGRHADSLSCLDGAIRAVRDGSPWPSGQDPQPDAPRRAAISRGPSAWAPYAWEEAAEPVDDSWWSPRRPATFGGRASPRTTADYALQTISAPTEPARLGALLAARARALRRLGRADDARAAWEEAALVAGPDGAAAWVEAAKLLEHAERDLHGALGATDRAVALLARRRALARPDPRAEALLRRRRGRLVRRIERAGTSVGSGAG